MRPVGEVEHRENLLDFVNWATGATSAKGTMGCTVETKEDSAAETDGCSIAERTRGSTSSCRKQDSSPSGQDISNKESNRTTLGGEVGSSGETKREVCLR